MEADDLRWRWSVEQLDVLTQLMQVGDRERDAVDSVEVLATRMRMALQAREHADDLVNRLMLALLDARATPAEVAELMGVVSAQAVRRRAVRERARLVDHPDKPVANPAHR